jgi:hypothetical protein
MFFQSSETFIQDHETNEYMLLFVHLSNYNARFRDNSTKVERARMTKFVRSLTFDNKPVATNVA